MERTWRDIARPIIEKVLKENKGKPDIVIRQALCKAVADGRVSKECVQANMPALNKMATALKRTMNIPGVQAVSRRV